MPHLTFDQISNLLQQMVTLSGTIYLIVRLLKVNAEANNNLNNSVPSDIVHKILDKQNETNKGA